jgi:hypothetical protein
MLGWALQPPSSWIALLCLHHFNTAQFHDLRSASILHVKALHSFFVNLGQINDSRDQRIEGKSLIPSLQYVGSMAKTVLQRKNLRSLVAHHPHKGLESSNLPGSEESCDLLVVQG